MISGSLRLTVPVSPSTSSWAPCHASRPGQGHDEGRDAEAREHRALEEADRRAGQEPGGDRQVRGPAVLDVEHRHDRRRTGRSPRRPTGRSRRAAARARRRSRSIPTAVDLEHQVGEVDRGEEAVVGDLEDRPDQAASADGRPAARARSPAMQRREQADAADGASTLDVVLVVVGRATAGAHRSVADLRRSAPVIARDDLVLASPPRRRTSPRLAPEPQHDDPVGDLEHVGQVVADHEHPEPAVAQALDQVEHLGGLGTPSAAVGSSSITSFGSPSSERAIATAGAGRRRACRPRCARSAIVTAERARAARRRCCSIADLVELAQTGPPLAISSGRGRGSRPRRGCRRARGPGRRWRCRASAASCGVVDRHRPCRRTRSSPASAGWIAGDRLDQRRLAGAVVAHQRDDLAGWTSKSTSLSAWTGAEALAEPLAARARGRSRSRSSLDSFQGGARAAPALLACLPMSPTGCRPPCRPARTRRCRSRPPSRSRP